MIGPATERGGLKESENAPNSIFPKINESPFWRFGTDMDALLLFVCRSIFPYKMHAYIYSNSARIMGKTEYPCQNIHKANVIDITREFWMS